MKILVQRVVISEAVIEIPDGLCTIDHAAVARAAAKGSPEFTVVDHGFNGCGGGVDYTTKPITIANWEEDRNNEVPIV